MCSPGVSVSVVLVALLMTIPTVAVVTLKQGRGGILNQTLKRSDQLWTQPALFTVIRQHQFGHSELNEYQDPEDHHVNEDSTAFKNQSHLQTISTLITRNHNKNTQPDTVQQSSKIPDSLSPYHVHSVLPKPQNHIAMNKSLQPDTLRARQSAASLKSLRTPHVTNTPETTTVTKNEPKPNKKQILYVDSKGKLRDCIIRTEIPDNMTDIGQMDHPTNKKSFCAEFYALKAEFYVDPNIEKDNLLDLPKKCVINTNEGIQQIVHCWALQVRVPTGFRILGLILKNKGAMILLYDHRRKLLVTESEFTTDFQLIEAGEVFISSSNYVNIVHYVQIGKRNSFVGILRAISRSPTLRVKRTVYNRGVVEMPAAAGFQVQRAWTRVNVPSSHVIMVSGPTFGAMPYCVVLYADDGDLTLNTICPADHNPPRAITYNTSLLHLHIYQTFKSVNPFQINFSFHNVSAVPLKLPHDVWNCSVPYESDFLYHLTCNMEVECNDAADEMNCSYTTDLCGPEYISVEDACFFYVRTETTSVIANVASGMCLSRGGRLAIINSPKKWNTITKLLPTAVGRPAIFFVGIQQVPMTLPLWYRGLRQWSDGTTVFSFPTEVDIRTNCKIKCSYGHIYTPFYTRKWQSDLDVQVSCVVKKVANVLCEKPQIFKSSENGIRVNGTNHWPRDTAYVKCPLGHYTHKFLACDFHSSCWYHGQPPRCQSPDAHLLPSFTCTDQTERVPYTLLCDHHDDCSDGSDEDFCSIPTCQIGHFTCSNKRCVPPAKVCDGWSDCVGSEDENNCKSLNFLSFYVRPPIIVILSYNGLLHTQPNTNTCPPTHMQCITAEYCLPVLLRCNGAHDCPGHEDEIDCDTCPGFYRCRASGVCLIHSYLCDGHAHCPQSDDELLCDSNCPVLCVCRGLAFFCRFNFTASAYPNLRFLDASGSKVDPAYLIWNLMLIHLSLANCSLTHIEGLKLPNLLSFNVEDNTLNSICTDDLIGVPQLRELSLAGNSLTVPFEHAETLQSFPHILTMDLSRLALHVFNVSVLSVFPKLQFLNLSQSGVERVMGEGFSALVNLRVIDLRGCPMRWFPRGMFHGLRHMHTVYANSYKVCCPVVLPIDFNVHKCFSQPDEISSCDDMLRGNVYSVCVFVVAFIAMIGNVVSFIFRVFISSKGNKRGYGIFVTHLSASDLLMGVYLAVIGVADQVYRGVYLWNEVTWRYSPSCTFAGFLSMLSSEVSVLIMCLITLDRFLVLRFPFSRLHFSPGSAHTASGVVWSLGVLLVSIPLLPLTSHWEFYSQTSICIPLPITRIDFAGHDYSFSIVIVFNFVLFVFISLGQMSIYWSVRANSMSVSNTTKKTTDLTIARRLITVAMTDFMCWFPIGVLGLLASDDFPIPGELNVVMAIFVLPLNSAVNPCLYTVSVIVERRSRARQDKLRTFLLKQIKTSGTERNE